MMLEAKETIHACNDVIVVIAKQKITSGGSAQAFGFGNTLKQQIRAVLCPAGGPKRKQQQIQRNEGWRQHIFALLFFFAR